MNAARDGCAACACDVMDVGFVMLLVLVHVTCPVAEGSSKWLKQSKRRSSTGTLDFHFDSFNLYALDRICGAYQPLKSARCRKASPPSLRRVFQLLLR